MAKQGELAESLVHQCYHYIAMNLEQFPVSYLSLLPLKVREELLWRLPIADLCMLEDTKFVEGFQDMEAYWKLPCEDFHGIGGGDLDVERYVEKWDGVEYAKEILYGQVVTTIIGCLWDEFGFHLPFDDELDPLMFDKDAIMIRFLYAVRKPSFHNNESRCELTFPRRYREKDGLTSNKDIVHAVVGCFKGKLPKIVAEIYLYEDIDDEYYDLLNEVVYLGVHGGVFNEPSLNFVEQIVQRSSCLEVIILESYFDEDEEPTSINEFVVFLSTQVSFLSTFQLFKVLTNLSMYTVLQNNLNKLVTAYFSAPTTHSQKILITDAEIKSYDDDHPPVIDQCYLQFKAIELDNCHFILKQKSTRRAITQWLGQDISTLDMEKRKGEDANFCSFKLKECAPRLLGRKRRHSEVGNDDMEP